MGNYRQKINPRTGQFNLVNDDGVLFFKAGVATVGDLPTSGNTKNDARITSDTQHMYVWDGSAWKDQGDIIDLDWAAINNKPSSSVINIDDAVTKKHAQNADTDLDDTFEATFVKKVDTVNELSDITSAGADIEDAVTKKHAHANSVELAKVSDGDHDVATGNPHSTEASDISTDTSGETVQDAIDDLETDLQEVDDKFTDMNEPTGFINRTDSAVTWSDSGPDYTLSIAPTGDSFSFYQYGVKYIKSGIETHQISGVEGTHYIYYDAGSLASIANPTFAQQFTLITLKVLVAIVYWDATNSEGIYVGEERHGITMDGNTHAVEHFSVGLRWYTGLALNTIDADQDGSDNSHAQFGIDTGSIADEDIGITPDAIASTVGLPVYWRSGADGDWRKDTNGGYSFLISGTRPNWNQFVTNAWQQTETDDTDFMLVHIFATTEKDNPMIAIMGQSVYDKKRDAREGATTEVGNLLLGNLPGPEITPIASVIVECKNGYTNDVNARIVTTDEGDDYVDWRTSNVTRTSAGGDHGSLGGLSDDDHTQYSLISLGAEAPGSTPSRVGEIYIDTTADVPYVSVGTASSSDWYLGIGPQGETGDTGATGAEGTQYPWEGEWTTSTEYTINDCVEQDGSGYICLETHTSGTFSTDLSNSKWSLLVEKGEKGDTGDTGASGVPDNTVLVPIDGNIEAYIAAATAGDTIILAAGTYTITNELTIAQKVHLKGQGKGITTITCATNSINMIDAGGTGTLISDMTISRSGAVTDVTHMLSISAACDVANVEFLNTCTGAGAVQSNGIELTSTVIANIEDCSFNFTGVVGVHIGIDNQLAGASTVNIKRCDFSGSAGTSGVLGNTLLYCGDGTTNVYSSEFADATNVAGGVVTCGNGAMNIYTSTLNGSGATAFDVKRTAGTLTLYDTTLVNNTTLGTITYGGTVVTKNEYIDGKLVAKPDEVTSNSEGVAASIATVNTEITTDGGADLNEVTLANGESGQIKHFIWTVAGAAGDTLKITPLTMLGGAQISFAAGVVGSSCTMVYCDSEGWCVVGHVGGIIA